MIFLQIVYPPSHPNLGLSQRPVLLLVVVVVEVVVVVVVVQVCSNNRSHFGVKTPRFTHTLMDSDYLTRKRILGFL